jgi:hypothetical protein
MMLDVVPVKPTFLLLQRALITNILPPFLMRSGTPRRCIGVTSMMSHPCRVGGKGKEPMKTMMRRRVM